VQSSASVFYSGSNLAFFAFLIWIRTVFLISFVIIFVLATLISAAMVADFTTALEIGAGFGAGGAVILAWIFSKD
jgi:hypothetical protein